MLLDQLEGGAPHLSQHANLVVVAKTPRRSSSHLPRSVVDGDYFSCPQRLKDLLVLSNVCA